MRLDISPYEIIERPRFGDLEHADSLREQWKLWKKQVKQVHDVFAKLISTRKSLGSESREFKSFLGSIEMAPDYAQKFLRDYLSLGSMDSSVINEAIRRFLEYNDFAELGSIDKDGYTSWERDL